MLRRRLPRLCAHTLAIVVLAATATFCVARGPEASAAAGDALSAATSTPAATLFNGTSKPASSLVTAVRTTKERRVAIDALLLGAGLVATLRISRRRLDRKLRERVSTSAYFERRRGPPVLLLAR